MPVSNTTPCPHCQSLAIWLERLSQGEQVDYYRCATCSYVWNIPKSKSTPVTTVSMPATSK